jgi:hypothetical protein
LLDDWGSIPTPPHPDQLWGPPNLLTNGYHGLTLEVKQLEHEADHSPLSNAKAKNEWSYTSTSQYVFTAWCIVKHRDNFTFTFNGLEDVDIQSSDG